MVVRTIGPTKIARYRVNAAKKRLKELEEQLVEEIKESMESVLEIEHLHELKDYIDDLIVKWEDAIVELSDDDIDDLLDDSDD